MIRTRIRSPWAVALGFVVVLTTLFASAAAPAVAGPADPEIPPGWLLVEKQDGGLVLKGDPNSPRTKPSVPERSRSIQDVCTNNCEMYSTSTRNIDAVEPGALIVWAQAWAYIDRCGGACSPCRVEYGSNNSALYWSGQTIYSDPDTITHTDIWDTDYLGLSISISYPPGGSVNTGSGRQEWATTIEDNWQSFHSWDSLVMDTSCGPSRITGVNYGATGSFQWGSSFYGISTSYGAGVV